MPVFQVAPAHQEPAKNLAYRLHVLTSHFGAAPELGRFGFFVSPMAKQTKANPSIQRELPLFQAVQGGQLDDLPVSVVAACNTGLDAIRLCMRAARIKRTQEQWAELMGYAKGTWSLMVNGGSSDRRRYIPFEVIERIQMEAGNRAVSQWFEMLGKGMLNRQQVQRYLDEAL